MDEIETTFPKMYRCRIGPTGEILKRITHINVPMGQLHDVEYAQEREMSITMPEPELRQFLNDFENWADVLSVCRENPHIQAEYEKLLILVRLLK